MYLTMLELVASTGFLSEEQERRLAVQQTTIDGIQAATEVPGYVGGLLATSRGLPLLIDDTYKRYFRHQRERFQDAANPSQPFTDPEAYETLLAAHGYNALQEDLQQGIFAKLSELVTGAALASGSEPLINHGLEFGRRLISQRAHRAAFYLADSCKLPKEPIPFFDGHDGELLFNRVRYAYGKNARTALSDTPKSEGRRFDVIVERIRNGDFVSVESRLMPPLGLGRMAHLRHGIKVAREINALRKRARDPKQTAQVLEETYDMFYLPSDFKLTDEEALFVARFAAKVNRLIKGAARLDPWIGQDPRQKHLELLSGRLSSCNVPQQVQRFERSAKAMAEREPAV